METLSGGMKRRLELARAVLHAPAVILLDEPSLGLDPNSRARLWTLLQDLNREGAALLVATNDVVEAERYCGRVAFLAAGRVVTVDTPAALTRGLRRDAVSVEWPAATEADLAAVRGWPGVGDATFVPPLLHATVDDAAAFVPALFQLAAERSPNGHAGGIQAVRIQESSLEDAYFRLAQRPLHARGPATSAMERAGGTEGISEESASEANPAGEAPPAGEAEVAAP